MAKTLSDRATASLHDLWKRRVFQQNELAERVGKPGSVINRVIHGRQPVTLAILEAVGELTGVDPMEMLAGPGTEIKALNPLETELLRYVRTWPKATLNALLMFLQHFAGESASEEQYRNAVTYLRGMKKAERDRALAYLLLLSEGGLPRDVRIALGLPETDEAAPAPRRKPRQADEGA